METWKVIENYDGKYEVSNLGNIKSTQAERVLKFPTQRWLSQCTLE